MRWTCFLGWLWWCAAGAGAGWAGSVTVISPHPEEVRHEFGSGFARWHLARFGEEAKVDWRDVGGSGEAQRFVESEFKSKPDGIGIDLFFGGGPEPFLALAERRLLVRHVPPEEILSAIPQNADGVEVYDSGHLWHAACLSSFGILENRRVQRLTGLPDFERWAQLAEPVALTWVGAGDPRSSGTMNNMYEAVLQAYGWEEGWSLLARMAANVRQFDRLSTTTAKDCALGQVAAAFCIDYFGFIQMAAAKPGDLEFVLARDFTALSGDGLAILRGAPNAPLAARFVDFVLSEAGQKLWYLRAGVEGGPEKYTLGRLPVRPDLYTRFAAGAAVPVNPFTLHQSFRYDARLARSRRDVVRALFGALFVDLHPELRSAWEAVISRGRPAADVAELGRVPFSAAGALELAGGDWKDPQVRVRMKLQWQQEALARYRQLMAHPTSP